MGRRPGTLGTLPRGALRVRWNPEVGWEGWCCRCPVGEGWWPLGKPGEFWDMNRLSMCIACRKEYDRGVHKSLANTRREHERERARQYRQENADVLRLKRKARWQALKADPERLAAHRVDTRQRSAAYRERRRGDKAA